MIKEFMVATFFTVAIPIFLSYYLLTKNTRKSFSIGVRSFILIGFLYGLPYLIKMDRVINFLFNLAEPFYSLLIAGIVMAGLYLVMKLNKQFSLPKNKLNKLYIYVGSLVLLIELILYKYLPITVLSILG